MNMEDVIEDIRKRAEDVRKIHWNGGTLSAFGVAEELFAIAENVDEAWKSEMRVWSRPGV